MVIYTVSEVSKKLGVSRQKVHRLIEKMQECGVDGLAHSDTEKTSVNGRFASSVFINDDGLAFMQRWLSDDVEQIPKHEDKKPVEDTVVVALLEQLRQKDLQLAEKDRQLSEKDNQIAMLMEQAKNYQVLLQGQQMLSLPAPKRSIFKRLFGRADEE